MVNRGIQTDACGDFRHRPWHFVTFLFAIAFVLLASKTHAQSLPQPTGDVILTVSGLINKQNAKGTARFDLAGLESLGTTELTTHTALSTKASTWSGVLVRDLLDYLGAKKHSVEFVGLDGYSVTIPTDDFYKFDVILATRRDGKPLTIRARGPARIIYPLDQNEALRDPKYLPRYVWQIEKMIVK